MGGTPLFALAIVAWPRDRLPLDLLGDVLRGGQDAAADGGWVVAGGHSIDGPEPVYGQAVIGEVDPDAVLTNAGARPGDALVLTKPIGTGLLATAVKRREPSAIAPGGAIHELYTVAVAEMTRTNAVASQLARAARAHAATDVTGFGLLGHLREMLAASRVCAVVDADRVPRLPGIDALLAAGEVPGGTLRNLDDVRPDLRVDGEVTDDTLVLLADAQTSGGLLLAVPAEAADDLVERLTAAGHTAARIGELHDPGATGLPAGSITVRG
jgi:selenide, water dikinase